MPLEDEIEAVKQDIDFDRIIADVIRERAGLPVGDTEAIIRAVRAELDPELILELAVRLRGL
jgi:hypothetical protein